MGPEQELRPRFLRAIRLRESDEIADAITVRSSTAQLHSRHLVLGSIHDGQQQLASPLRSRP